MTWTPEKRFASSRQNDRTLYRVLTNWVNRPENSVHEGLDPRPLFCNPVLMILARAIADNTFRDYSTIEELLEIEPPKDEIYYLRQKDSVLSKPFFYIISTGEIEKADTFSRRLRELGIRAGYLRTPTICDFRAESLYLISAFFRFSRFT